MSKASSKALKDVSNSTNKEFKLSSSSKCSTSTSPLKLAGTQSSVKQDASKLAANGYVRSPVPSTASQVPTTLLESRVYSTPSIGFFYIDSGDKDSPLWAADLVKDLYKYWRSVELPIPDYIEGQSEITARKRAILMAWLIEVKRDSGFEQETLYSVVGIIDRFLGKRTIEENKLQLLGLGALLIATKYEETWHFCAVELVDLCANAYDEKQILEMETEILDAIDFRLTVPNPQKFIVRFLKAACKDLDAGIAAIRTVSQYILDLTLLSYTMNTLHLPSELAALSVYLARQCLRVGSSKCKTLTIWSETLWYTTGYSARKLEQMVVVFMKEKGAIEDWGVMKSLKKTYNVASFDKLLHQAAISFTN